MTSKKSATWQAAKTGCTYYLTLPIGIILIFSVIFLTGGLITGLLLLLHQWFAGISTPLHALLTVGIFFALFALMLPMIAPIIHITDALQKRYQKARKRLNNIHNEQARIDRLIAPSLSVEEESINHVLSLSQDQKRQGTHSS